MNGFQTEVRAACRTIAEAAADTPISITVELCPDVALQLAQFAKRSTFDTFYDSTDAHLPHDERQRCAYQMISGIESIGAALAVNGYVPR